MKGILIGHADNGVTGVTAILSPAGAVGGADVRGGAPGTRETDLLSPLKMMEKVNAVVLSGGSAYGLEASCGVMEYLRDAGAGFNAGGVIVPIVAQAVLFDLNNGYNYPDKEMGKRACEAAKEDNLQSGGIGAGTGATVGKIRGIKYCGRGGLGAARIRVGGAEIIAVAAVNAFGDVVEPLSGEIIAGARDNGGGFINTEKALLTGDFKKILYGTNTTIAALITDAKLNKVQANKLASAAHDAFPQVIKPVHTDMDGDAVFALATGEKDADFNLLCVGAVDVMKKAILNAVRNI